MDLRTLLAGMKPELQPQEFVYVALSLGEPIPAGLRLFATIAEKEGNTLILERSEAERAGLSFAFPCRMITLTVHSALEAVGFLAAIAAKLTQAGIPANTISAFYHDHLFIPASKADAAMAVLRSLSAD
ncbi:ACT domain-containing protein [Candidatus Korobacter versatilis]|nr:ACT domain-containing protein [Candidatus Koribacter versatilis]